MAGSIRLPTRERRDPEETKGWHPLFKNPSIQSVCNIASFLLPGEQVALMLALEPHLKRMLNLDPPYTKALIESRLCQINQSRALARYERVSQFADIRNLHVLFYMHVVGKPEAWAKLSDSMKRDVFKVIKSWQKKDLDLPLAMNLGKIGKVAKVLFCSTALSLFHIPMLILGAWPVSVPLLLLTILGNTIYIKRTRDQVRPQRDSCRLEHWILHALGHPNQYKTRAALSDIKYLLGLGGFDYRDVEGQRPDLLRDLGGNLPTDMQIKSVVEALQPFGISGKSLFLIASSFHYWGSDADESRTKLRDMIRAGDIFHIQFSETLKRAIADEVKKMESSARYYVQTALVFWIVSLVSAALVASFFSDLDPIFSVCSLGALFFVSTMVTYGVRPILVELSSEGNLVKLVDAVQEFIPQAPEIIDSARKLACPEPTLWDILVAGLPCHNRFSRINSRNSTSATIMGPGDEGRVSLLRNQGDLIGPGSGVSGGAGAHWGGTGERLDCDGYTAPDF